MLKGSSCISHGVNGLTSMAAYWGRLLDKLWYIAAYWGPLFENFCTNIPPGVGPHI